MKAKLQAITLLRAEGPSKECGNPITVYSWDHAQAHLILWGHTAPKKGEGYDKCDFQVTWANGDTYAGRYDLQSGGLNDAGENLQQQVKRGLLIGAGIQPEGFDDARWARYTKLYSPNPVAKIMLESCEV